MLTAKGAYYRIKTDSSGKRVRLTLSPSGRVLETKVLVSKVKRTKTGRRLAQRRRRISR
jgi:hypothetical protein